MTEPHIFLSYVREDKSWAEQLTSLLAGVGIAVTEPMTSGESWEDWVESNARTATHTLVLIGAQTRWSRHVDHEIEVSTESRETGPGAALIGVILPTHEDFDRPYYDPENVPLRLHDLIQTEYAMVRKWSDKPDEIRQWLEETERRRHYHPSEPSLRVAAQLYRFSWDDAVDAPRSSL